MKDAGLFMGWKRPVPGKESMALELWASAVSFWENQKNKGRIESYEPVLLAAHAGDLNGFMLIKGKADKLGELRRDKDYLKLVARCGILLEGFGAVDVYRGDGVQEMLDIYRQSI